MMMFYRRRASPKHYNDMTEVEYGDRGHRTRLRNDHGDQLVCSRVPPASVYKGGEEGRLAGQGGEAQESPTPSGSRIPPPILVQLGFLGGEKRRRGPATSPSPNRTRGRGGAQPN